MSNSRMRTLILATAALALIAAGCGSDADSTSTEAEAPAPATTDGTEVVADEGEAKADKPKEKPKPDGTVITTAESPFGEVLFTGDQGAIYLFDKEKSSESECYGDCAVEWPPVLTKGEPQAKGDVAQGKLGTTKRDDGTTQVTYDGQPLYLYHDEPPGQVLCHNVPGFGGLWLVLDAKGNAV